MSKEFVEMVLKRLNETDDLSEIVGINHEELAKIFKTNKDELIEIINSKSYTRASIRLLRWLGFDDEEIDVDKMLKAMSIIKHIVLLDNMFGKVVRGFTELLEKMENR